MSHTHTRNRFTATYRPNVCTCITHTHTIDLLLHTDPSYAHVWHTHTIDLLLPIDPMYAHVSHTHTQNRSTATYRPNICTYVTHTHTRNISTDTYRPNVCVYVTHAQYIYCYIQTQQNTHVTQPQQMYCYLQTQHMHICLTHTHTHTKAELQSTLNFPAIIYITFIRHCSTPAYITHVTMWHIYSSKINLYLNDMNNNTGMRRLTTFRSTTKRIYCGGPILLQYNIIILTTVVQMPTVFSSLTRCTGL